MKVLILGGTGMLGYPTALEFLRGGHEVHSVSSRPARIDAEFDKGVHQHALNLTDASDEDLLAVLRGMDVLIYALGPDDRVTPPAPALTYFRRELADRTARLLTLARQAGVRKAVVFGSYFATFDRLQPAWGLAARHPYVQARVEQARRAIQAGQEPGAAPRMDVVILEIPYVFGVTPGREPFWKAVLFDRVRGGRVALYPKGGSVVMTTTQLAQAAVGAALHGPHGAHYPVGDVNMTWTDLIGLIRSELGVPPRVVHVPEFLTRLNLQAEGRRHRAQGLESGLNPETLAADIMYRELYPDVQESRRVLGYASGGVQEAIRQTVRASYPKGG